MVEPPAPSAESLGDGSVPPKYRGVPDAIPEEGVVYRHFKGDLYRVVAVGELSEARQISMTVYFSLKKKKVNIRPTKMFTEDVVWPDGVRRPRFTPDAVFKTRA